ISGLRSFQQNVAHSMRVHGLGSGGAFSASLAAIARFRARAEPFKGSSCRARLTLSAAVSILLSLKSRRASTKRGSANGRSLKAVLASARAAIGSGLLSRARGGESLCGSYGGQTRHEIQEGLGLGVVGAEVERFTYLSCGIRLVGGSKVGHGQIEPVVRVVRIRLDGFLKIFERAFVSATGRYYAKIGVDLHQG